MVAKASKEQSKIYTLNPKDEDLWFPMEEGVTANKSLVTISIEDSKKLPQGSREVELFCNGEFITTMQAGETKSILFWKSAALTARLKYGESQPPFRVFTIPLGQILDLKVIYLFRSSGFLSCIDIIEIPLLYRMNRG